MKCYVYAFYDKKIGAYERPIVNNYEPEDFKTLVVRDVLCSTNEVKDRMCDKSLYKLGFYDDAIGEFNTNKPEFLMDIAPLIVGKQKEDDVHA